MKKSNTDTNSPLSVLSIGLITFLVGWSLVIFNGGWLGLPPAVSTLIWGVLVGGFAWNRLIVIRKFAKSAKKSWNSLSTLDIFLGGLYLTTSTLVLTAFTWLQKYTQQGLQLESHMAHDAWWHIALMQSLGKSIPPENPLLSGTVLSGYHYFTDLIWVSLHQLTGIPYLAFYLWISPWVLGLLFALTSLAVMSIVTKKWHLALLGASFLTLGSGLAVWGPLVFPAAKFIPSLFWLDQVTQYGYNHQLLFALSVVNVILILLHKYPKAWAVTGILIGSLVGIKAYGALVLLPALLLAGIWQWTTTKQIHWLKTWLMATLVTGALMLVSKGELGWPFIFLPGWFFKTQFESSDRLHFEVWELQRQVFAADHNLPRLIWHWGTAALTFFVGNFGLKILGLIVWIILGGLRILQQILSLKKIRLLFISNNIAEIFRSQSTTSLVLWLGIVGASFAAPSLFIQKGTVWNSIQFLHFAQTGLVLLLVTAVINLFSSLKSQILALSLLLALSLPTTIRSVYQLWFESQFINYSHQLIEDTQNLSKIPKDTTLMLSPTLTDTAFIPAISGRSVFWTNPGILSILGTNTEIRQNLIERIKAGQELCPIGYTWVKPNQEGLIAEDCKTVN